MKRSYLFLLVLCNFVWTLNPLMGKVLLSSFTGFQVAWVRYFGGFLAFFLFALLSVGFRKKKWSDYFLIPTDPKIWVELVILGVGPFVISPIFQFVGLESAQAIDNSILVATEPLITVLLAWMILREKMNRDHWISMILALVGFLFFSGIAMNSQPGTALSVGILLMLCAQFGEGAYSVFSRKLVLKFPPTAVLGSALAIGALTLTAVVSFVGPLPSPWTFSGEQWGAALWLGPIGSTLAYLIWAVIAQTVTVPVMAITLFIQPICGAFLGYFVLGERLTVERGFGAFLILVAIAFLSYREVRRSSDFAPN